jgi:NAD-dependent DNA ligase
VVGKMALVKKLLDSSGNIEWYGEVVEEFRAEDEFEVDGIVYKYPHFRHSEQLNEEIRSVTPNYMFDLYEC